MKRLLIVGVVLAVGSMAFAGGNPDVQIYISFDQTGAGGLEHSYTMVPGTFFNAYVCVTELGEGFTAVAFALTDVNAENPGMFAFEPVFSTPFETQAGNVYTGISVATGTCRTEDVVIVGQLSMLPTMPGDICLEINDYPAFPRWVVDCTQPNGLLDYYCVLAHGTIGAGTCPEGDCPDTPIEEGTWGGIKALYR